MEEEEERGVAHIVEHLAFSATQKYTNHDIIKFLESVGAEFGACQNASTSVDETVYELFVPVDKPELLSQAISVLAEFSSEVATASHCVFVSLIAFQVLVFWYVNSSLWHRFEHRRMTLRKKEELLWKNTEGEGMLPGGCRMRIGF